MRVAALAGGWALAEMLLGLTIGEFAARARAEAVAFLAVRPPLLVVLAWAATPARLPERWRAYAWALIAATLGESAMTTWLGGPPSAAALLRQLALSLLFVAVADIVIQFVRRRGGRVATVAVAVVLLALASVAPLREGGVALALSGPPRAAPAAATPGRRLAILTALPIVWGEGDVSDILGGHVRGADIHPILQRAYAVQPIDRIDQVTLANQTLLLIAQPRALDPVELVALDDWVRGGGRALLLADPALAWPSRWPLGDRRRAPPTTLLDPLLTHWGLGIAAPADAHARAVRMIGGARLESQGVGRFTRKGGGCTLAVEGLVADCRIGRGRALLVADADFLDARQWRGPGPRGAEREQRRADNVALLLGWLAALDGRGGVAARPETLPTRWIDPAAHSDWPLLIGLLPGLGCLGTAWAIRAGRLGKFGEKAGESRDSGVGAVNSPGTAPIGPATQPEIPKGNS
ncbi:Gldg family protein [Sphingomonas sanxanigenens]|uniref:ABC-type uncharacterized transport system domain-containing protein n=1 Tax=Sphingomonas sanxanigenens DSM 19645 = NX02 TaxID=1123269 RepID=W0A1T9_9SPHN|nr:hypothetical protein [Sphingomonas sanxanigenens]AHE51904.1 hypothetical protein NX02_00690 [Sphingomonas sanxanigenens DSM 19645 = NX02]